MNGACSGWLERAMYDPSYHNLSRFFLDAPYYLLEKGKIYLAFSNCGDMRLFKSILKRSVFKHTVILEMIENNILFFVLELTI